MALRYIDSMGDHYTAADATNKWTDASNHSRKAGLHGYAMTGQFRKGIVFGSPTTIFECYVYIDILSDPWVTTYDSDNQQQVYCGTASDGSITISRFGTSTAWPDSLIGRTPPDTVRQGTWYHVGVKIFHHVSAGAVEIRINGGTVLLISGVPTVNQITPSYWSGLVRSFRLGYAGGYNRFDDLVVMDDVPDGIDDPRLPGGGGFTKFIGPVEVRVKRPSGPGLSAAFTPTPTVPNYQNVADIDPDGDATVNTAAPNAVGATDLFAMEDLLPGEDVLAVQSLVLARKTEEGIAALATVSYDGVTTRAGTTVYQPSTYSYMHAPEPLAPDGTLWTAAKWNAMQYGYRRII